MKTLKTRSPRWTSAVSIALSKEILELSQRYSLEIKALDQTVPGSDEYITHWSEAAVLLSWLREKTDNLIAEMEKLEETWPA